MTFGRRVLGDSEGKGFVWATRRALDLARLPVTAELRAFWRQLNRAAFRVVGEEFPNFVGDPARAARTQADGQRALASGGPVRQALAGRYVAGMTPGYRVGHGLGGNIRGLSRAEVNRWRNALRRRAQPDRRGRLRRVQLRAREQPHIRDAGHVASRRTRHGGPLTHSRGGLRASRGR